MSINRRTLLKIIIGGIGLSIAEKTFANHPNLEMKEKTPHLPKNGRILFQGDSITDGNRGRNSDPNHILGHGYAFIISALCGGHFPEQNWTFMNRGISGNKITDLAARWQKDTLDLKPDVLSILIGINDASSVVNAAKDAVTVEQSEKVYDELLEQTKTALPNIKFVLCEPFVTNVGQITNRWDKFQADVPKRQQVVENLAKKYKAPLVRFQKVFDDASERASANYWIWDGIHPTYSGHQLMADEWLKTVNKFY